jgi:UDP-N-acetylmuramate--alanine ligase
MPKSQDIKKIHFIGIGGIGVSALARYYLAKGVLVSGSDAAESEITEELKRLGAKIPLVSLSRERSGPNPSFLKGGADDVDLLIYSAAVQEDNPELTEARKKGIKCQTYAEALGDLTKKYFTIAVSGMHGKSTTTAMIGLIMEAAGLDPTVIVGTKVRWNQDGEKIPPSPSRDKHGTSFFAKGGETSNCRIGKSKYLVIEADEYDRSFLNYWPKIIVLTNIEEEHLDTYKNLEHIKEVFVEYLSHLSEDGLLIANDEDKNVQDLISNFKFLISKKVQKLAPSKVKGFKVQNYSSNLKVDGLNLKIPGAHNLSNAAAAITAARILDVPDEVSVKALNNFTGTWRRMEYKGLVNGAKIYDDYGHHPTEIKATLKGARELLVKGAKPDAKLWCVFQPHQYQRTYKLFDNFLSAFDQADKAILLPIYSVAGRENEEIKNKVNSDILAEAIKAQIADNKSQSANLKEVLSLDSFEKTAEYLKKNLAENDICIIMGAGDIYKLSEKLKVKSLS